MAWDDDIHLGSFSEIGESLRGMQDTQVGAQQALSQLRGALGQLASQKFGGHAPLQKTMRSPYKDSTQIGIKLTGTFTPANFAGSTLPQISGLTRVYKSFKPTKAILSEIVVATWTSSSLGTVTTSAHVGDASDLVLQPWEWRAVAGAPTEGNGISGVTFANNSLGNGISWPTINGGIDMTVAFAIEQTVLFAAPVPAGFTQSQLVSVAITARFNLLGPSLR